MKKNGKSVRFASAKRSRESSNNNENNGDGDYNSDDERPGQQSNNNDITSKPKAKRYRPNEDELDDIDDYNPQEEEDDEDKIVPKESELLRAKRTRRERRGNNQDDSNESTSINETTSLASDGITIEPFHMKQEETDGTGYFDGDTYVFRNRKDPDEEEPDAWLESLQNNDNKDDEEGERNDNQQMSDGTVPFINRDKQSSSSIDMDKLSSDELYSIIVPLVSDTETVLQAVSRYGQLLKRKNNRKYKKRKTNNSNNEIDNSAALTMAKQSLDDLTGAANALLSVHGDVDIYQKTRNDILPKQEEKKIKSTQKSNDNKKKPPTQWEYMGNLDKCIHGPYTTEQMVGWTGQGYFIGAQHVQVRTVQASPTKPELSTKEDLLADLMDDDDNDDEPSNGNNADNKVDNKIRGEWVSSNDVDFKSFLQ